MKRTLITLCAAALTAAATAQTTYLSTDFEDGMPAGFTFHDEDGRTPSTDMANLGFAVGTPWIVTEEGKEGNHVACSTSWYKNAGQSDDWMVTTAVTVSSAEAVLSWRSRASDKDYRDGFAVYVSETGTEVADFDKTTPLYKTSKENYSWTEHSISLADYVGKTIYIAFVNNSKDCTCLYVDDLFIGVPSILSLTTNLSRVVYEYGSLAVTGTLTPEKDITGYTIGYSIDGNSYSQTFNGAVAAGQTVAFTLDQPFTIERNQTVSYTAWATSAGDSTGVSGRMSAYPWKIVSEEVTGTWCGYCVRGIVGMKTMREKYPDTFIGIAIHSTSTAWPDAMAAGVEDYLTTLFNNCSITGYPHCVFNRNPMFSIDPGDMETYYPVIRSNYSCNAGVELKASYNEETGLIDAQTTVAFAADEEKANYKLAYVLIENNVHRTHADTGTPSGRGNGYDQSNYYAGGSKGEMGGFEDLPSTVPAEQMWYNDVARAIWPDYNGEEGIIPTTVEEGVVYTDSKSFSIPDNVLKAENTELIVLLLSKNGTIVNADKVEIAGLTDGIKTVDTAMDQQNGGAYYTLSGIRVADPAKGVYIHNGRKVVIR